MTPQFETFNITQMKDISTDFSGKPWSVIFQTVRTGTYNGDHFELLSTKYVRPQKSETKRLELKIPQSYNLVQVMKDFEFSNRAAFRYENNNTIQIWEHK